MLFSWLQFCLIKIRFSTLHRSMGYYASNTLDINQNVQFFFIIFQILDINLYSFLKIFILFSEERMSKMASLRGHKE